MRDDNNGFSLVEIIVVIAIMAIIGGMLFGSLGFQASTSAGKLADSLKVAVGETRIKTMGKQETLLYLYKDASDGKYYKQFVTKVGGVTTIESKELIGKHYPVVEYSTDGSSYTTLGSGADGIVIGFDRTNGKEKAGISASIDGNTFTTDNYTNIKVSGGNREYMIKIVPATGKVTLE